MENLSHGWYESKHYWRQSNTSASSSIDGSSNKRTKVSRDIDGSSNGGKKRTFEESQGSSTTREIWTKKGELVKFEKLPCVIPPLLQLDFKKETNRFSQKCKDRRIKCDWCQEIVQHTRVCPLLGQFMCYEKTIGVALWELESVWASEPWHNLVIPFSPKQVLLEGVLVD